MRRSRWIGLALLVLLTPAVVAGAVMLRAHRLLADPGTLARGFSVGLGRGLTFESIDVALWPPGIVLRGVELADRSKYGSGELAHVDAVWLQAGIPALVRGDVRIEQVVLEKPTLRVVLGPEGWNLGASEQYLETPEAFDVQAVTATGLRLVYRDRTRPGVAEFELRNGTLNALRSGDQQGWTVEVTGATEGVAEAARGAVSLQLRTPSADKAVLRLEGSVEALDGSRVGELAQLVGGDMPFGSQLVGVVSGRLRGSIGTGDIGFSASRIEMDLDLTQCELLTREGWVLKPTELPATVHMEGGPGDKGFQVDLFEAEAASVQVRARRDQDSGSMILEGSDIDGRGLESVLPLLAAVRPRGKFDLGGVVTESAEGRQLTLKLRGHDLTLLPEDERWTLGQLSLGLGLRDGDAYLLVARASKIQGQEFALDQFAMGYLHSPSSAPLVDIHAGGLRRADVQLDGLWARGEVPEDSLFAGEVKARAFGGHATGVATLGRLDGVWEASLDASWEAMDVARLENFLGLQTGIDGELSGTGELVASGGSAGELIAGLRGPLEMTVEQARLAVLDPLDLAGKAFGRFPLVGGRFEGRLLRASRQMAVSGSDQVRLWGSGLWEDGRHQLDRFELSGPVYEFIGAGQISSQGGVELAGDFVIRDAVADELRKGDSRLSVVLGKTGPIVLPLLVEGAYPQLVAQPDEAFLAEFSKRARRGGRSLGDGIRQQLREALSP